MAPAPSCFRRCAALLLLAVACADGQQTGLTDGDCKAHIMRETPSARPAQPLTCKSKHRDWSSVALVANDPTVDWLSEDLPTVTWRQMEVIAHTKLLLEEPTELVEAMSGANHWLVFSRHSPVHGASLSISETFNRLVMMASADIVILAHREDAAFVNEAMVDGAAQIFSAYPNLGMIGTNLGYTMGGWIQPSEKLQYVAAIEMGPIVVRRSAFLEVGMLDCLQDRCMQEAFHSLSLRMLLAGMRIGIMSFPNRDGELATRGELPTTVTKHPKPECDATGVENLLQKAVLKYSKLFPPKEYTPKRDLFMDGVSGGPIPDKELTYCFPQATCAERITTGILIQYFKRPEEMGHVLQGLHRSLTREYGTNMSQIEIVINDDSHSDYEVIRSKLTRLFPRAWLIYAPDTHEIRAYNRMAKLSTAHHLVFAQDDDAPSTSAAVGWHSQYLSLFRDFPDLGFLGAHRGRLDLGYLVDGRTNQISGPKFGTISDTGRNIKYKGINHFTDVTGIPFMFVYKINAGPLFVQRSRFLKAGMFHTGLSCPGEPGIGFDFEYSIRTWSMGQQVGLFSANWTGHIGDATESGTRNDSEAWMLRRRMEMHNNGLMYEMYPEIHHMRGTKMALEALDTLKLGEGAFRVREDEDLQATLTFLHSFQYSRYCDELGYTKFVKDSMGTCCKEFIVPPDPDEPRRPHTPEEYQCVTEPRQWDSVEQAMREYLEINELWLEEEASWYNLHRYINGTVLYQQKDWQAYLNAESVNQGNVKGRELTTV